MPRVKTLCACSLRLPKKTARPLLACCVAITCRASPCPRFHWVIFSCGVRLVEVSIRSQHGMIRVTSSQYEIHATRSVPRFPSLSGNLHMWSRASSFLATAIFTLTAAFNPGNSMSMFMLLPTRWSRGSVSLPFATLRPTLSVRRTQLLRQLAFMVKAFRKTDDFFATFSIRVSTQTKTEGWRLTEFSRTLPERGAEISITVLRSHRAMHSRLHRYSLPPTYFLLLTCLRPTLLPAKKAACSIRPR